MVVRCVLLTRGMSYDGEEVLESLILSYDGRLLCLNMCSLSCFVFWQTQDDYASVNLFYLHGMLVVMVRK